MRTKSSAGRQGSSIVVPLCASCGREAVGSNSSRKSGNIHSFIWSAESSFAAQSIRVGKESSLAPAQSSNSLRVCASVVFSSEGQYSQKLWRSCRLSKSETQVFGYRAMLSPRKKPPILTIFEISEDLMTDSKRKTYFTIICKRLGHVMNSCARLNIAFGFFVF